MHIHFVTPTHEDWILRRIARSFQRNIKGATLSELPDYSADANVYVNAQMFAHHTACDIGFFTHREIEGVAAAHFDELALEMDGCVAMCNQTATLLPKGKTTVIQVGPDDCFKKKSLVFGVVGREYQSGRKRYDWISDLRTIPEIEIRFTNGKIPWRKMPSFYRKIDYLLVLSDNEGGPIPVLEALRMGVPVISSNVGFVSHFTSLRYNSKDDLMNLVKRLIVPKDIWQQASSQLVDFILNIPRQPRDVAKLRAKYEIPDTLPRKVIRWARLYIPETIWDFAHMFSWLIHWTLRKPSRNKH